MTTVLSEALLFRFSKFLAETIGLYFPRKRWRDLERGMTGAAAEFGFEKPETCVDWLLSSPLTRKRVEILAAHLTVGETYFFRDKRGFEVLGKEVLAKLIAERRMRDHCHLRIWSAACATGEEPYSVAILVQRLIPDLHRWNVRILATDISHRSLEAAAKGVYNRWAFRETPKGFQDRYFQQKQQGRLEILPNIRRMVTFSYLNLVDDTYPTFWSDTNGMDVILCRNVLMYFTPEQAEKVVRRLYCSLAGDGWLLVSPIELSHSLFSQFASVSFPGCTFYRKESRPLERRAAASPWTPPAMLDETPPEPAGGKGFLEPAGAEEPAVSAPVVNREVTQPDLLRDAAHLSEQGRYEEALRKTHQHLSKNQEDAEGSALLARVYANQGELAEALTWCEKTIVLDKLNPCHHYLRASILQEQGAVEDARIALCHTLYLNQNFVPAHVALGNLNQRQGRSRQARKHFENALALLNRLSDEDEFGELEGVTAERLVEMIRATAILETCS